MAYTQHLKHAFIINCVLFDDPNSYLFPLCAQMVKITYNVALSSLSIGQKLKFINAHVPDH